MGAVEIRNVTKSFGAFSVVKGISLEARDGEFLVLLGPSGCGKSTLMRIIAGIEAPTSGEIFIDRQCVTDFSPRARNVAMVFQTYALYPHLTVRQNIEFPLKKMGTSRDRTAQQILWAANMFRIAHLLDRKPKQLSGGERQRVALARAMVREPSLFMLDEPLSNLDAKLRTSAREEIQQFQRQTGTTTIYVTHDQVEAMALGDRIAVLSDGVVRQVGRPEDIYNSPADTFVATFVGSPTMNLVETDSTIIGFRPEQFLPADFLPGNEARTDFPVVITRIEKLGSSQLVYGELQAPHPATKVVAEVPAIAAMTFNVGEQRIFQVRNTHVLRFDKETRKLMAA